MKFSETFVGRAKELTVNKSRLESLLVGTPFVTSVVGDAGIGKTKYCAVVMQMATDFGITVVRSVSSDHGGVGLRKRRCLGRFRWLQGPPSI